MRLRNLCLCAAIFMNKNVEYFVKFIFFFTFAPLIYNIVRR